MKVPQFRKVLLVLAATLLSPAWLRADGVVAPDPAQINKAFAAAVQQNAQFTPEQKQKVAGAVDAAAKNPDQATDVITTSLGQLYPDFAAALGLMANEQNEQAIAALDKLRAAPDAYLAAYAGYFQARAFVGVEAYEQALPLLAACTPGGKNSGKITYGGEALFLRGVCERKLLKRSDAIKSFTDFVADYPQAAERLRLGAAQQLLELTTMKDASLDDVEDRMDFSHNRLAREKSDKDITQPEQQRIVTILDKMIKEQEDKEKQQGQGGGKSGSKSGKKGPSGPKGSRAGSPAERSVAPPGEAKVGNLHDVRRGNPEDSWGADKERQRQEVLDALKAKFPERYRELLKEYYQSMTDETATESSSPSAGQNAAP